jgi:putative oxidoreductase
MHTRMTTSSRTAALLAPVFIQSGWDALRRPESKVKAADAVIGPLSSKFDFVPKDPATAVRINGAVQCAAGFLLAAGKVPRLAALILAGSLVPTTYADHPFWTEVDDEDRARQVSQFLKNTAILGGLVLVGTARSTGRSIGRSTRSGRRLPAILSRRRHSGH